MIHPFIRAVLASERQIALVAQAATARQARQARAGACRAAAQLAARRPDRAGA
jgi:hypothetical protein